MSHTIWKCSGRTAGRTVACDFESDSPRLAFNHYERTDHDVDEVQVSFETSTQVAAHVAYYMGREARIAGTPFYQGVLAMARQLDASPAMQTAAQAGYIAADGVIARDARSASI